MFEKTWELYEELRTCLTIFNKLYEIINSESIFIVLEQFCLRQT